MLELARALLQGLELNVEFTAAAVEVRMIAWDSQDLYSEIKLYIANPLVLF